MMQVLVWLLFIPPGAGPSISLSEVVDRAKRSDLAGQQYTSLEDYTTELFDGSATTISTERYENIFVNGRPYRHILKKNGSPLSDREAKQEQARLERLEHERHPPPTGPRRRLHRLVVSDFGDWLTLFDATQQQEEPVNGRPCVKILLTPRTAAKVRSDRERQVLHTRITLWVDEEDLVPARRREEYLSDTGEVSKGSALESQLTRVEPGVWVEQKIEGDFSVRLRSFKGETHIIDVFSHYKKFRVDSRVLPAVEGPQ